MRRNKPGLADLKTLRQLAQPQDPPPPPDKPLRAARKRAPFLPPSPAAPASMAVAVREIPETSSKARSAPAQATRPASGAVETATPLSEADRKLFRYAVRYVDRIKDPGRVLLAPAALAQASILEERRMRAAGMEAARPRKPATTRPEKTPPARTERKPRPLSDAYAPAAHDQDDSRYLKTGHGSDILRDLKRGKWPIGASLDLHGSTLEDARERFERFLGSCLTHGVKCVQIVHGKGYGSPNGDAVLKTTVRRWLTQLAEVIAYVECSEADGGAGAVQVLLKTS